jgi:hypothetical protein
LTGSVELSSQVGIGIYERGRHPLLAVVNVHDDLEAPVEPMATPEQRCNPGTTM